MADIPRDVLGEQRTTKFFFLHSISAFWRWDGAVATPFFTSSYLNHY